MLSNTQLECGYCSDRLGEEPIGDILYFDYGCIAFWGLTQKQEQVRWAIAATGRLSCFANENSSMML